MSHPSQVVMSEVPVFMTQGFISNVISKLGFKPISASITKDKKGGNKGICTIQFANEDAAREAVSQLNGKPISISSSGSSSMPFKLRQGTGINTSVHNVWVGDLSQEIDDYRFFKFFGDRFKSLCDAKVIVDDKGASRGFGFLKFSSEEDQRLCVKIMNGSLDLGSQAIKVAPTVQGCPIVGPGPFMDPYAYRIMSGDPWCRYTSWNQFIEPPEYPFIAVKLRLSSFKPGNNSNNARELVKYNDSSNTDYLNFETLERDCHLWDALECSKWLPGMALSLPQCSPTELIAVERKSQDSMRKEKNSLTPIKGTLTDYNAADEVRKECEQSILNAKKSTTPSKSVSRSVKKVVKKSASHSTSVSKAKSTKSFQNVKNSVALRSGPPRIASKITRSALHSAQQKKSTSSKKVKIDPSAQSSKNLINTLESEITDSLTKLFKNENRSGSPYPEQKRLPPKGKSGDKIGAAHGPKSSVLCFQCGDRGHGSLECPHPIGTKMCYNCQKLGNHKADDCPEPPRKRKFIPKELVIAQDRAMGKIVSTSESKISKLYSDYPEPPKRGGYVARGGQRGGKSVPKPAPRQARGGYQGMRGARGSRAGHY